METKENLLKEIMELDFALTDLNLYLNTHPCCPAGICLFNEFNRKYQSLKCAYAQNYGPLTIEQVSGNTWDWIKSPWPWEKGE